MKPHFAEVTLVIPGRNAERTISSCMDAAVSLLGQDGLREIIFVDDGSTDRTREIVGTHPVTCLKADGRGPGAARNLGWRTATTPLVWFIDADCVTEPDALRLLLPHLDAPDIAGVGGSYGNMRTESLLACLIHEEIVQRHLSMPADVDFLATFNVLYYRHVLEELGGFREDLLQAQDAEFAYRVRKSNRHLRMEAASRVKHYHPDRLWSYLKRQARGGFWRIRLYSEHPDAATGDAYSGWIDHSQPPLALVVTILLLITPLGVTPLPAITASIVLAGLQLPMTRRIVSRCRDGRYALFVPLGWLRAFARALGMVVGVAQLLSWYRNGHRVH